MQEIMGVDLMVVIETQGEIAHQQKKDGLLIKLFQLNYYLD